MEHTLFLVTSILPGYITGATGMANNEAAFQAQKTLSPKEQLQFTKLRNPKDAKNWEEKCSSVQTGKE